MKIEYEATFIDIKKDQVRQKLKELGATLKRAEFMQKRATFNLPRGHEINGGWLRVRDEGNKITLTLKVVDGNKIENQREILLNVDSFEQAVSLLSTIGCSKKSFQESKRELWILDGTEITIDEWPFLEPYVEVEGKTEQAVKDASKKMGFDYSKALFCTVDTIYEMKYGVSKDVVNKTPEIKFNTKNPFSK
jgi:adenylate cyclase class 2